MNWKPLKEFNELPKNENFLIWDSKAGSGISIYEGMVYKGEVRCPATCDVYFSRDELGDFTHWCEIVPPTAKQENYTSEQTLNGIPIEVDPSLPPGLWFLKKSEFQPKPQESSWEEKFRWETARQFMLANPKMTTALAVLGVDQLIAELKKGRG